MKSLIAALCALALVLTGCAFSTPEDTGMPSGETALPEPTANQETLPTVMPTTVPPTTAPPDPVELLLAEMTLREKVGQLFLVRPESVGDPAGEKTFLTDQMKQGLEQYPVGGFVLFGENLTDPQQLRVFLQDLQAQCAIGPFLAVDEEGGAVARLGNHWAFDVPRYSSAAAVGSSGDAHEGLLMGDTIGGYLREYGFNMDFAPVADVNTNPANPVIGSRAFSSDPHLAAEMADAVAMGLAQQGIVPVFKHFPGHGDTAQDSHSGLALTHKTREQMLACEWIPFRKAGPLECVMVAHVAAPELTGDQTPSTMSRTIVTEILQQELGFSGLVITDSLEMGAITQYYTPRESALAALEAGCHILLMPQNLPEAFEAVVEAVESGAFDQGRLDHIVRKILEFKRDTGIVEF